MTMDEIKKQLREYIEEEVSKGTRKANIEIELLSFIRNLLYPK